MKTTKILVMLLALVLVFALVACGGEKEPEVTDGATVTTTAAATTTKAAATTTKAATTTTAAPVVTTTAAPVAVAFPNTIEEYKSLFVTDGNVFHLNFAEATVDSPALVGSAKYEDETVSAMNRFTGAASNYTPYLFNSMIEDPVSGGTAKILTPWFFADWYADWTVSIGSGKAGDMRTSEPEEYVKTEDVSGTTVYVVNTKVTETDFYIQDGKWAKKTYASTWGNGYINVGFNSTISFNNASKQIKNSSYTVQFVTQGIGNVGLSAYLGCRYRIEHDRASGGILVKYNNNYVASDSETKIEQVTFEGVAISEINGFTFTFDRSDVIDEDKTTNNATLGVYINNIFGGEQTVKEQASGLDGTNKIFEGADYNVYAIRLYNRVLTAEEVAQNHFADLALVCRLDITEFLKLDDAAKESVYTALADYTYDIPQMLLQKALNDAIAAAK